MSASSSAPWLSAQAVAGGVQLTLHNGDVLLLDCALWPKDETQTLILSDARTVARLPNPTHAKPPPNALLATKAAFEIGRRRIIEKTMIDAQLPTQVDTIATTLECFSTARHVSYGERVALQRGTRIVARSAGSSIGSANWFIEIGGTWVVYLGASAFPIQLSSSIPPTAVAGCGGIGSCTPLDMRPLDSDVEALIFGSFSMPGPPPPIEAFTRILAETSMAVQQSNPVLLPRSAASGETLVLVEALATMIEKQCRGHSVPVFFVSPVAPECIAVSDSLSEWVEPQRSNRAMMPELPFRFEEFVSSGRILLAKSLSELSDNALQRPGVFVLPDASLRGGDSMKVLHMLRQSESQSLLLLTEPVEDYENLLRPYSPLGLVRVLPCPIDARANCNCAAQFAEMFHAKTSIIKANDVCPNLHHCTTVIPLQSSAVDLRWPERHISVNMEDSIMDKIRLEPLGNGLRASRVTLDVSHSADDMSLKFKQSVTGPKVGVSGGRVEEEKALFGQVGVQSLLHALAGRGLQARVEDDGCTLVLKNGLGRIVLRPNGTFVDADDFDTAVLLQEAVRGQLQLV